MLTLLLFHLDLYYLKGIVFLDHSWVNARISQCDHSELDSEHGRKALALLLQLPLFLCLVVLQKCTSAQKKECHVWGLYTGLYKRLGACGDSDLGETEEKRTSCLPFS